MYQINIQDSLTKKVHEALDSAKENHYLEDILSMTLMQIAEDLVSYDAFLEEYAPENLIIPIMEWLIKEAKETHK